MKRHKLLLLAWNWPLQPRFAAAMPAVSVGLGIALALPETWALGLGLAMAGLLLVFGYFQAPGRWTNKLRSGGWLVVLMLAASAYSSWRIIPEQVQTAQLLQGAYTVHGEVIEHRPGAVEHEWIVRSERFYGFTDSLDLSLKLRVVGQPDSLVPRPGQAIQFRGVIEPVATGSEGYTQYLTHQGVAAQLAAYGIEDKGPASGLGARFRRWRRQLATGLSSRIPTTREANVAVALALGDRTALDSSLRDAFSATGVSHTLALSGLHVGILVLLVLGLGESLLFLRLPIRAVWVGLLALVAVYAVLTGASPSVLRAAGLILLVYLPRLFRRDVQAFNVLCGLFVLQLLYNPLQLQQIGFQLSYAATAGLILVLPRLHRSWPIRWLLIRFVRDAVFVTLVAQTVLTPLLMAHFGTFSVYFLPANLVVAVPVILSTGLAIVLVLVHPVAWLADPLGYAFAWIMSLTIEAITRMANWPGALLTEVSLPLPLASIIVLAMLYVAGAWAYRSSPASEPQLTRDFWRFIAPGVR